MASSSSSSGSFIKSFKIMPKELFRINNGRNIALRERSARRAKSYDLLTEAGKVKPKALDPQNYTAPNGASMRPNGNFQQSLVEKFRGQDIIVYAVPEGTALPSNLILVHEHSDHYSLQPAVEMSIDQLNQSITEFFEKNGTVFTRDQWLQRYRASAQEYQLAENTAGESSSSAGEYWTWSKEYSRYYHMNDDGSCMWDGDEASSSASAQNPSKRGKGKGTRH